MTQSELFDLNSLAEAKRTMKAKFGTMVQYFLEDSESYIIAIKEAITANNVEAIISPSHTLKSSSKQMGAERLSNISKEIEAMAREQTSAGKSDFTAFHAMVDELQTIFIETKSALPAHTT